MTERMAHAFGQAPARVLLPLLKRESTGEELFRRLYHAREELRCTACF